MALNNDPMVPILSSNSVRKRFFFKKSIKTVKIYPKKRWVWFDKYVFDITKT